MLGYSNNVKEFTMKNLLIKVACVTVFLGVSVAFADVKAADSPNTPQFQHFAGEEKMERLTEQQIKEAKGAGKYTFIAKSGKKAWEGISSYFTAKEIYDMSKGSGSGGGSYSNPNRTGAGSTSTGR